LSEVIEGMDITLKSTGTTILNTVQDKDKIKENILEVVDALNMVKGTILQLSKVDSEKDVGEYDTEKLSSSLTWQMGSALTGNYGVQLVLSSYNNIVSGMSYGFKKKDSVDDIFGDLYTTLSELGITTNTNSGSDSFGLLEVDETKLDEALEKDSAAVINLLSSSMTGTTSSADFTVASTGVAAKAGSYSVTYDVDANGQATNVYINGVLAQTDSNFPGRWTVGDMSNEAAGVAIQFANGGMAQGSYSSSINIRQGKLNELIEFLDQETTSSDVEGVDQGHIPTIIASFRETVDQLKEKIDSETTRIANWEQREKLKYSRLEQTLTEYNSKMNTISSYAQQLAARSS
jgi:flagellar hook-associated protein 2